MKRTTTARRTAWVLIGAVTLGGMASAERLTYTEDVAPILNENCVSCHRPGQIAPMSLMSYEEIRPWVKSIRKNVANEVMPPWHASESAGEFVNDRSLTEEQIDTIVNWIDQGAARGNPADAPPKPEFPDDKWQLGEPDKVVTLPEVEVPASGPDKFRDLTGEVALPEDRWVKAVEILPGNPKVVHHAIVYQIKGFDVNPEGGWLAAWAAGTDPMVFPEGTGRLIEKGANLVGDMHYHPCGTPETDQSKVGLHFADDDDIQKELVNTWIMNTSFKIPAGAPNHEVRASHTFLQDVYIHSFAPHMHYRGKDFLYRAVYPDGSKETLLRVDNYDFNWQTNYVLEEPLRMPEGTTIECVAHFDNSADNPSNPDPTKAITFGPESYDEMMIGFLDITAAEGVRPMGPKELRDKYRKQLSRAHPGEVYGMYTEDSENAAPLYLPREGDGVTYLSFNDQVRRVPVEQIQWNGDTFKAQLALSGLGKTPFQGTWDESAGELTATLTLPDGDEVTFTGERVEAPPAAPTSD